MSVIWHIQIDRYKMSQLSLKRDNNICENYLRGEL